MANLFQRIENGMTFEQVCDHYGLDPDKVEDSLDCRCPHGADAYGREGVRIEHMTSAEADRSYDSL